MKPIGTVGRLVRLYNTGVQLRTRWKRTPVGKRRELVADLVDVALAHVVRTGTATKKEKAHGVRD